MRYLFLLLMLISGNIFAQNYISYYNIVNEADYRLMTRDTVIVYDSVSKENKKVALFQFEKAKKLYLEAFKLEKPFERDYFQLARCYAGLGDTLNMIKYLKLSSANISFNPLIQMNTKRDSVLFYKYKEKEWYKECITELEKNDTLHKIEFTTNKEIKAKYDTISYFWKTFTNNRKELVEKKKELTLNQIDSLNKIIDVLDKNLRKQFFKYVSENGFPEYKVPGSKLSGSDFLTVLLSNMTEKEFEIYNPILINELNKGNLIPQEYGFISTKINSKNKNNKCLYLSTSVDKECWAKAIEERKKVGMSIYLDGSPQNIQKGFVKRLPWVGTLIN